MKRFMGMMPRNEIAKEGSFEDHNGWTITVQAGPNGWTVLWADHTAATTGISQRPQKKTGKLP